MAIYHKFDAYDYIEIGGTICVCNGDPELTSETIIGTITELSECDSCGDTCSPCQYQIGIDNKNPDCFRYGNDTAIEYIITKDDDFIKLDEFSL